MANEVRWRERHRYAGVGLCVATYPPAKLPEGSATRGASRRLGLGEVALVDGRTERVRDRHAELHVIVVAERNPVQANVDLRGGCLDDLVHRHLRPVAVGGLGLDRDRRLGVSGLQVLAEDRKLRISRRMACQTYG